MALMAAAAAAARRSLVPLAICKTSASGMPRSRIFAPSVAGDLCKRTDLGMVKGRQFASSSENDVAARVTQLEIFVRVNSTLVLLVSVVLGGTAVNFALNVEKTKLVVKDLKAKVDYDSKMNTKALKAVEESITSLQPKAPCPKCGFSSSDTPAAPTPETPPAPAPVPPTPSWLPWWFPRK